MGKEDEKLSEENKRPVVGERLSIIAAIAFVSCGAFGLTSLVYLSLRPSSAPIGLTNIIQLPPSLSSAISSVTGTDASQSGAAAKKKSNATDTQGSRNRTNSTRKTQGNATESVLHEQFFIVSEMNGKVVTITNGNTSIGAEIIMKSKNPENPNGQLWYLDKGGYIHSALNKLVITAKFNDTARMAPFSKDPDSHWKFKDNLIANDAGDVLDVRFRNKTEGASLTAFKFHGTKNERWRMETFKQRRR